RRFGMPARRIAHPARDGTGGKRRESAGEHLSSDRTVCQGIRYHYRRGRQVHMTVVSVRSKRRLTRADIMPLDEYVKVRRERRREVTELKRNRRVEVGPFATFYFENAATMWQQVQEMLYIEKGGDAQIDDELMAYNPLIPQGRELVATVMFEI